MKPYVLNPILFSDYIAEALCPACGCRKREDEKHMTSLVINGQLTWGCELHDDQVPVRHGMLVG